MKSINNKIIIFIITIFMIFALVVLYAIITDDSDEKFMQELSLHQKIDEEQIESIRMSKVILDNSYYKHFDIELSNTQIQRIITLFNSISQDSVESASTENLSISSGIAIRMKDRSEVRIQYDKKNIYVTRSEVQYIIEDNDLKEIFDKEL